MRRYFALSFILLIASISYGQSVRAFEKAGDKAFKNKDYGAALEYFRNAMEMNDKKVSLKYKYAEVARLFYAYDFAIENYKAVKESDEAKNFPLTNYWLGDVYRSMGRYDSAINLFNQYLASNNGTYKKEADQAIKYCEWAKTIVEEEDNIKISQLNKRVNTPYSEFGPLLKGDTLFYTSFKFDNPKDDHEPRRKISKVMTSIRGSKGKPLRRKFNADGKLTAHTTFSQDNQRIYYTVCEYQGEMEIRCDIFMRDWNKKRRRWNKAKKLPDHINVEKTSSTHPNIAFHMDTKEEFLFYTSNRSDGKGGLDIWYAPIDSLGKVGKPKAYLPVNTSGDEITPFYHQNSNTLFFSSNGRQSLGGYDVYKTLLDFSVSESDVLHTGYPLNSSYNDVYFVLNADSTVAYLSSNRLGSMYLEPSNKSCCNDIYKVQIIEPEVEVPGVDSLTIVTIEPKPPVIEPEIPTPPVEKIPTTLEDFLPLALYFDNDEPDKRTRRNTTKKSYLQTFEPYYSRLNKFRKEYSKGLIGETKIIAEQDIDIFFDNKVKKGADYLALFSDILLQRLEEGEKVEIFVKGYTSPRAKSDYNIHLGRRRISSIKNHFNTYQNNIFKPYLQNGQLTISERSFGETTAQSGVNDDLNNQRLSIYSPEASLERRVEIVEIIRE